MLISKKIGKINVWRQLHLREDRKRLTWGKNYLKTDFSTIIVRDVHLLNLMASQTVWPILEMLKEHNIKYKREELKGMLEVWNCR